MSGVLQLTEWAGVGIRIRVENDPIDLISQALSSSDERVVFDLRVGDRLQRGSRQVWREMPKELKLKPGECIRVSTVEKLSTSKSVVGFVLSRASLAADGLYVSNIKVDPQFTGWLEVAVFNASRDYINIKKGMPFASLMFMGLRTHMTEDLPRIPTETKAVRQVGFKERFRLAAPFIITGAVSVAASVLADITYHFLASL
jgi:dUTPase